MTQRSWPWSGVFGGALFWYGAHEFGLYFSAYDCKHVWIVPAIHLITFIGAVSCGFISYLNLTQDDNAVQRRINFSAGIGVAAAALFALVILWQGIAALIFSGCAR